MLHCLDEALFGNMKKVSVEIDQTSFSHISLTQDRLFLFLSRRYCPSVFNSRAVELKTPASCLISRYLHNMAQLIYPLKDLQVWYMCCVQGQHQFLPLYLP